MIDTRAEMTARSFRDPVGRLWTVWAVRLFEEDGITTVDPERAEGWLEFQTQDARRRLAPIPSGWRRLTDEELWKLCGAAEPVVDGAPAEE